MIMVSREVFRWNLGLAISFVLLILGYFAKLKYEVAEAMTSQSLKSEEEKNLISLLLMINGITILYWIYWPCPYKFTSPIAKNQSVTTRVETLIRSSQSKKSFATSQVRQHFMDEPRTFQALKAQNQMMSFGQ